MTSNSVKQRQRIKKQSREVANYLNKQPFWVYDLMVFDSTSGSDIAAIGKDCCFVPPPELVQQWDNDWHLAKIKHDTLSAHVATQAARWGADQELEACCEWLDKAPFGLALNKGAGQLRLARRPKPPSLKEQAKFAAAVLQSPDETCSVVEIAQHWRTIRRALESMPDSSTSFVTMKIFPTTPSQSQQLEMLDLCQDILDYIELKEPYFETREEAPEIWHKLCELRGNISGWDLHPD